MLLLEENLQSHVMEDHDTILHHLQISMEMVSPI